MVAKGTPSIKIKKLSLPTPEELLDAGVHFGHQKKRWHPKIAPYLYKEEGGVHIFDLFKTREKLSEAVKFLADLKAQGGRVVFVGTKKQAQGIVEEASKKAGVYFLTQRWIGGLLTNFSSVKKNIDRLSELREGFKTGAFSKYTKKERLLLEREMNRLEKDVGGLLGLDKIPEALVLSSAKKEEIAISEARIVGVPTVAICDTNSDPTKVTYPIPGNDDASSSIRILINALADAVAS